MVMIDRGVKMLTIEELHDMFNNVLAMFECIITILAFIMFIIIRRMKLYDRFPASLFQWLILLDFTYATFLGPLRWLKGNSLYEKMAHPTTESGCRVAVFIDTFCQIGILYTNTVIVSILFYMIYTGSRLGREKRMRLRSNTFTLFLIITFSTAGVTCMGEVHNYVGWCTADSISVVFKQMVFCLAICVQITLVMPILWMLWQSARRKNFSISVGSLFRFVIILITQLIGLFPVLLAEFLGLARKPVPEVVMYCIAFFIPAAQFLDITMVSIKLWPKFFHRLEDEEGHCGYIAQIARNSLIEDSEEDNTLSNQSDVSVKSAITTNTKLYQGFNKNLRPVTLADPNEASGTDSEDQRLYVMVKRKQAKKERKEKRENKGSNASTEEEDESDSDWISEMSAVSVATTVQDNTPKGILDKVPFWFHLCLTVWIPFGLLLLLTAMTLLEQEDNRADAAAIRRDIVLTAYVSDFVHESQKERGATGVFMGSGGKKFQCEILAQYQETDFWQDRLQIFLNIKFSNVKLVTKSTFLQALINMLRIKDHREGVQTFAFSKGVGIGYYTTMNMFFVGILAEICKSSTLGKSVNHMLFTNLAFFSGKEITGIERAKGASTFLSGKYNSLTEYRNTISRVTVQDTHLWFFAVYVTKESERFYDEEMDSIYIHITDGMREALLSNDEQKIIDQDDEEWFFNMTQRINIIRLVESTIVNDLQAGTQKIVDDSTTSILYNIIYIAAILVVDCTMILGVTKTARHVSVFSAGLAQKQFDDEEQGCFSNMCSCFGNSCDRSKYAYHVLIPVLLCFAGVLGLAALMVKKEIEFSQTSSETLENVNLQFFMSDFIHETQKERGTTGVYMGSNGKKFQTELDNQKKLVNDRLALLDLFFDEFIDYNDIRSIDYFTNIFSYIDDIIPHRINCWLLAIPMGEGLGYYVALNTNIVLLANEIVVRAAGGSVEAGLLGYLSFVYMKEKAGNERAVAAGVLGLKVGWEGQDTSYRKFVNLVAIQDTAYIYFKFFGKTTQNELFDRVMLRKGSKVASSWRNIMLEGETAEMSQIDSGYWFGNMTLKINGWRLVELQCNEDLLAFFDAIEEEAVEFQLMASIALVFLLVIALFVIVKGIRLLLASRAYILYKQRVKDDRVQRRELIKEEVKVLKKSREAEVKIKGLAITV